MQILLNPSMDTSKVAKWQPIGVEESSTFVVDLTSLKHPDDVKKGDGIITALTLKYSDAHLMNLTMSLLKSVLLVLQARMYTIYAMFEAATQVTVTFVG